MKYIEKLQVENKILVEKLQARNKALTDALQYLVDTKERKDTIGKDSIYMQRKNMGWLKAKSLLRNDPFLPPNIFKDAICDTLILADSMNETQIDYCFKNKLFDEYTIGPAAIIKAKDIKFFNTLV